MQRPEARRAKHTRSKNLAIAIWQPCLGRVCRVDAERGDCARVVLLQGVHGLVPADLVAGQREGLHVHDEHVPLLGPQVQPLVLEGKELN